MKKFKKQLSVILSLMVLCMVITGCGSNGGTKNSETGSSSGESKENTAAEAEVSEVNMALFINGAGSTQDIQLIEDGINKITIPKIGAKVKITPISASSYSQQMTLMLSGDEPLDLMVVLSREIATYASRNQIIPLNELLDKEGTGIKEALGNYYDSASISGDIYAVPTVRDLCRGGGLNMRKDLLDKYDIDIDSVKTLEDMTPVFEKIKKGEGESFYPLVISSAGNSFLQDYVSVDPLDDFNGVLLNGGIDNTDVVMYEETDDYKNMINLFRQWYLAGYIQKDIATTQEAYASLLKAGVGFSYFSNCKPGITTIAERNTGYEIINKQFIDYFATSSQVNAICWAIAQNSKNPETAMKVLNLMYSDKDVVTTLSWGIEGTHYVYMDDKNFVTYPEGVDDQSSGWTLNTSWLMGNQFLVPLWEGEDPELWTKQKAANDSAKKSMGLGFTFDGSKVKTEIAAVASVRDQYRRLLENGVADPDENLPEYISKLKAAGIDKIVAEKKAQFESWLSDKK